MPLSAVLWVPSVGAHIILCPEFVPRVLCGGVVIKRQYFADPFAAVVWERRATPRWKEQNLGFPTRGVSPLNSTDSVRYGWIEVRTAVAQNVNNVWKITNPHFPWSSFPLVFGATDLGFPHLLGPSSDSFRANRVVS